jgi:hypothetical protein
MTELLYKGIVAGSTIGLGVYGFMTKYNLLHSRHVDNMVFYDNNHKQEIKNAILKESFKHSIFCGTLGFMIAAISPITFPMVIGASKLDEREQSYKREDYPHV